MYELSADPFYGLMARHPDCCVDYCLMKSDAPYRGEESHRAAIRFAMERLSRDEEEPGSRWRFDAGIAAGRAIDPAELLSPPSGPWNREPAGKDGGDGRLPYWYAFLCPPHGSRDTAEDFQAVNRALFPAGTECLIAREWTTDWSDYFDDGREWWGAACWSVYDSRLDRYAVILASATD